MRGRRHTRSRSIRAVVAAGVIVTVAAPAFAARFATPVAATAPCDGLKIQLERWTRLPAPSSVRHVAGFAERACTFIGATSDGKLYRATDARTWAPVTQLRDLAQVNGITTEEVAAGTGFVFGEPATAGVPDLEQPLKAGPSGLQVTRDYGSTFEPVTDFSGREVTSLAAAPSDPQTVYATASLLSGRTGTTLFKSSDFGRTWSPLPGALPAQATEIGVDARTPDTLWLNTTSDGSAPAAGVWLSTDGGITFSRARADAVLDFDSAPILGGAGRIDIATASGIVRSRDQGTSFRTVGSKKITALTHETFAPGAIMAIVDGIPSRSVDGGTKFSDASAGLGSVGDCPTVDLTRDNEFPSYFLLSLSDCGKAGHYVFRSDGRDLLNLEEIGGEGTTEVPVLLRRLPRTEMRILREMPIPIKADGTSGSLAFDGQLLYYTNNQTPNVIHRMTTDGAFVDSLTLPVNFDVRTLTYDPHSDKLWFTIHKGDAFFGTSDVFTIDPDSGRFHHQFSSPVDTETSIAMDPSERVFRSYAHHGYELFEIDMNGTITDTCTVPGNPVDPNVSANPDRSHAESNAPGFASMTAVGNGMMYVQSEDDRTIYHVSEDCEILGMYEHRRFAESRGGSNSLENDQMACDSVTFSRPAIWIRDSGPETIVAYAVPDGYCPLNSRVEMTPPDVVAPLGEVVDVCATVQGLGRTKIIPVVGAELHFFIGDEPAGMAVTDLLGRGCLPYTADVQRATTLPTEAVFFGNQSFRGSKAVGSLRITTEPRPVPPPDEEPPLKAVPPVIPPPPPPPHFPVNAPAQAPAPQQQPQPNPQQQPQAQGQGALAKQEQEQVQLAFVHAADSLQHQLGEQYAMTSLEKKETFPPGYPLLGVAMALTSALSLTLVRVRTAVEKVRR